MLPMQTTHLMQIMHPEIPEIAPVMRREILRPKTTHQEIALPEIKHPTPLETHLTTTAPIADKIFC